METEHIAARVTRTLYDALQGFSGLTNLTASEVIRESVEDRISSVVGYDHQKSGRLNDGTWNVTYLYLDQQIERQVKDAGITNLDDAYWAGLAQACWKLKDDWS